MSESPKERIPEEDDTTEAPLTMAASVVLTNLPKDASKALETAGNLAIQKGAHSLLLPPPVYQIILFHPHPHPTHILTHPRSNNPSPTHRLRPTPNPTHLQTQHQPDLRHHRPFPAQETGCEGA
jgi:hypothetical protein